MTDWVDRFTQKINRSASEGCWLWTSASNGRYGVFWKGRGNQYAHRLAYELWRGPVPAGLYVCHTCDNGHCVNPEHLFLGTAADNQRDCSMKGRRAPQLGELNPRSKLTTDQVMEVRRLRGRGFLQREIASVVGVQRETISKILRGERWANA